MGYKNDKKYIISDTDKLKNIVNEKIEWIKEFLNEHKFMLKPFFIIALILVFSISAIIRADFNYRDDLGRVARGYREWGYFSRYVSTLSSIFLHADTYLTDISPLPQILAVCIIAFASVILIYVYKNNKKFSFWDFVAIIPLGLSPYFLECFSYKYDAPYMALSVLASVIPLLFKDKGNVLYVVSVIMGTLVMCMTYQAASGIFLMFALCLFLKNWNEGRKLKENLIFLVTSIVGFILGLLIFKVFIMHPVNTYVSNSMLPLNNLISGSLQNLQKYISLVITDFKKEWLILILGMMVSYVYIHVSNSKLKKIKSLTITVIGLICMALLSFGAYPVLSQPLFYPRALYGFGMFIVILAITISNAPKAYVSKLIVFALSWVFISFSFTYGNALKQQKEYADFRINLVMSDLNDLEILNSSNVKKLQLKGSAGDSPAMENIPQDYVILRKLVPRLFESEGYFERFYFYNYFKLKNIEEEAENIIEIYEELPVLKDTMYHTIKGNEERILVELK